MLRVVIDTNLILSGLFWRGVPGHLYDAALSDQFDWLISPLLIAELRRVLNYPKFSARLLERQTTSERLVADVEAVANLINVEVIIPADAIRDPKDLPVLACAVGGHADYIVSGDQDLLVLGAFRGIPVVSAAALLVILEKSGGRYVT